MSITFFVAGVAGYFMARGARAVVQHDAHLAGTYSGSYNRHWRRDEMIGGIAIWILVILLAIVSTSVLYFVIGLGVIASYGLLIMYVEGRKFVKPASN